MKASILRISKWCLRLCGTSIGTVCRMCTRETQRSLVLWSAECVQHAPPRVAFLFQEFFFSLVEAMSTSFVTPFLVTRTFSDGTTIEFDIARKTPRTIYMARTFEPHVTEYILTHLREGGVFVDVGANIGYYAVRAAARVGPSGHVMALEPEALNFSKLTANVARNNVHHNTTCVQKAATDAPGTITLHLHPINDGGHSIEVLPDSQASQAVAGDTLDALVRTTLGTRVPDLIKIDVEGFELGVLRGMTHLLDAVHPPEIICEVSQHKEELFALLYAHGYKVYSLHGEGEVTPKTHARKRDYLFKHTGGRYGKVT